MPVNQTATVKTNPKRGSVASCSMVGIAPVTFKELWANYVEGAPYKVRGSIPKGFENQCAIRMSATLHKVGVKMSTFSQNYIKPEGNAPTLGRILLDGKATATRANEMSKWLETRPVCGIGPAQNITGSNWKDKVKGKTRIIFFGDYWPRDGESSDAASGGHIDLWNGSSMTPNIASTLRFTLGINSLNLYFYRLSDLNQAKKIMFFEVR
ncbi:type VI secretion system amidase effector protein Tae4 [Acinetobacter courvalinii]|uniref:Type VI secretion system (T6SS), amidase effector protein 4 n=1 Tax=Acinetobacter courvalinii TaxID=280147 RepID=N9Q1T9_9GAMM|nr:type VI secretion system amidase effector protein Tae4 [Acinetobacter courvalinii]ENX39723.1 hypothetical protein F888_01209 [Acinetobacter courvalinii]KAB0659724.1 hypothetical protein F7P77_06090 [Acinetobacter courvalinii]RSN80363.1 hypothetical protein EA770_14775 [Acinetobacter baumannii]GGH40989.1 hypothetical protein GCM10007354_27910 [Acinetobacter courvalinii]